MRSATLIKAVIHLYNYTIIPVKHVIETAYFDESTLKIQIKRDTTRPEIGMPKIKRSVSTAESRTWSVYVRTFSASSRIFTDLYGSFRISSRIIRISLPIFSHL
jgi:hypothetical protein